MWQSQRRSGNRRCCTCVAGSSAATSASVLHVPAHRESNQLRPFALAGCRMAVTAAQRRSAHLHLRGAPLAPLHVPAHRESNQLRPCSSWVPYGSHSGAAAIGAAGRECAAVGAVALAPVAVTAADVQRHWLHCTCQPIVSRIRCDLALAGCRMAVTAAQRRSAQLHPRRWQ